MNHLTQELYCLLKRHKSIDHSVLLEISGSLGDSLKKAWKVGRYFTGKLYQKGGSYWFFFAKVMYCQCYLSKKIGEISCSWSLSRLIR